MMVDGEHRITVRLHRTNVLTFRPNGDVIVTSGGWHTPTTKDCINAYMPGYGLSQDKGVWYLYRHLDRTEPPYRRTIGRFADGLTIRKSGKVIGVSKETPKADRAFKRRVKAYTELCAATLPMAPPGGGDCWLCLMRTQDGQTLGDAGNGTDHLDSHMSEGYVVPSLVYNAMKESRSGPLWFHEVFADCHPNMLESARREVKRCVRRYILKRFGYAV
jgi:hypothetical protein